MQPKTEASCSRGRTGCGGLAQLQHHAHETDRRGLGTSMPHTGAHTGIFEARGRDMPWEPAVALQLPAGAAGPFGACRPFGLPARSAEQAALPLQELPLEQVHQALKVACTSA